MDDGSFGAHLAVIGLLIAATTFIHAIAIAAAGVLFRASRRNVWGPARFLRDAVMLSLLSLLLMAAHIVEIAVWAAAFIRLELFHGFETALYFAAISYTTLGFGDLVIEGPWRLLSGAAAANGLLLFGLSAAFMVETSSKLRLGGERR